MSGDLRQRIAEVLVRDAFGLTTQTAALRQADAVIAELGLESQAHYDPDCDYYRYVTDWIDPRTHQRVDLP